MASYADDIGVDCIGGALCFFFFSSRRRHTRLTCDWSSDVCSSDLSLTHTRGSALLGWVKDDAAFIAERVAERARSEERRVGKEGRSRRSTNDEKKQTTTVSRTRRRTRRR